MFREVASGANTDRPQLRRLVSELAAGDVVMVTRLARRANPALPYVHACLASAYALKGENERAAAELAETWRLSPDGRYSSIAGLKASEYFESREVEALVEATYFAGLRKAGVPEE